MCGRYALSARHEDLEAAFDVDTVDDGLPAPDYNVAPTVVVPAVLERVNRQTGDVRRKLTPLFWGLVPSWAKDTSIGSRLINARVESLADRPAFRRAFAARRCVLPADGFYEWYALDAPPGTPKSKVRKQPFFIRRRDHGILAMAGIYEIWRDPTKDWDDPGAWRRTCAVITTEATDAAGHIHERMPMTITGDTVAAWLDPHLTDTDAARHLLEVTAADQLEAYAVSTAVNSVNNNDPSLLDPLDLGDSAPDEGGLW